MKIVDIKWVKQKKALWKIFIRYFADFECPYCGYLMQEWELHYNFGKNRYKKYYAGFFRAKKIDEVVQCPRCMKIFRLIIEGLKSEIEKLELLGAISKMMTLPKMKYLRTIINEAVRQEERKVIEELLYRKECS